MSTASSEDRAGREAGPGDVERARDRSATGLAGTAPQDGPPVVESAGFAEGPATVGERADHLEDDPAEDERGWSFAARTLSVLLVLLVGVGLGVWAAPRVAPLLPSGLAPVSAWLAPGEAEARARLAALEGRLDDALAAVDQRFAAAPDAAELQSHAQSLVSAAREDLSAEIASISATVSQSDLSEASARIGRLEAGLEGAASELASLKGQIEAGAVAGAGEDAAASIDLYRAELDGLRAEIGGLSGSVSALGARLDEAEGAAAARIAEAQEQVAAVQQTAASARDLSAAQAELATIRAALAAGEPYGEPLGRLASAAGIDPPAGLEAAAATGVATTAMLRASFPDAAHEAIRAGIVAGAGDGMLARSRAFVGAQVASRSLTPQAGMTPDAVLSRMEDALRRDDLETALAEARSLPTEAAVAMNNWLAEARLRAAAEAGLAEASASVSTLN